MMKKIPFQNRIVALILSLVFTVCLILSLFALPIEFVFFNQQSYTNVLENEDYAEVLPKIMAETLIYQTPNTYPINIQSNKDTFVPILAEKIPLDLAQSTFSAVNEQMLAYLNFKVPSGDMKIDISDIKDVLAAESNTIASDYLATFPNCLASEVGAVDFKADITAADLPACKPSGNEFTKFEELWQAAFEDTFNDLPAMIALDSILPLETLMTDQSFYFYSLVRWGFRLLPIITILLLISIAALLRNQREVMWKWCGRLLVIVPSVTLLGLIILLIGFDQFVAMLLNPFLKNLVTGFGFVVLGAAQDLGFQTLIWVFISALVIIGFGFFLLLAGRFTKPKKEAVTAERETDTAMPELEDFSISETEIEKSVVPETLEEIEEAEKKRAENDKEDDKS